MNLHPNDLELIIDALDYRADCLKASIRQLREDGVINVADSLEIEFLQLCRIIRKLQADETSKTEL